MICCKYPFSLLPWRVLIYHPFSPIPTTSLQLSRVLYDADITRMPNVAGTKLFTDFMTQFHRGGVISDHDKGIFVHFERNDTAELVRAAYGGRR